MPSGRRPFLPPSPGVEEPYRLTPKLALRLGILGVLALAIFAILFLRLWALQVLSGEQYLRAAQNNQLRAVRVDAPRGVIVDRHGRMLVGNVTGPTVRVWPADLPEKGRYQMLKRLARIVRAPVGRIAREVDARRRNPASPVTVKEGVPEDVVLYIAEHRREFPGVDILDTHLRTYPYGAAAVQALGHVGEVTEEQLKLRRFRELEPGDKIGQSGLEAAYDHYLRGRPGRATLRVDSLGRPRSSIAVTVQPRAGNAIRTTLDARLQLAAERALVEGIERARASGCSGCWAAEGGALVALDARDGAVLAMASRPRYNPDVYVGRPKRKELAPLLEPAKAKKENFPGLNRATAGLYPPGSTFKPVTALAALEEHLVLPYQSLPCTGSYEAYGQTFRNWDPYVSAPMVMTTALAASCDTYFYELGNRFYHLRESPLQEWAIRFGFGRETGIDIGPEEVGLVPTPTWRRRTFKTEIDRLWKPGDSIQLAIGQKDLQVTPLQMTRFYAMLANGGRLVTPHLFLDVEGPGEQSLVPHPASPAPVRIDVDPLALKVVRDGLFRATHDPLGTSSAVFSSFPIAVAGKTGTAEKWSEEYGRMFDQAWWCGYAPADAPRLVVCAVIENGGHGGSAAAPAALEVFEEYFDVEAHAAQPEEHSD